MHGFKLNALSIHLLPSVSSLLSLSLSCKRLIFHQLCNSYVILGLFKCSVVRRKGDGAICRSRTAASELGVAKNKGLRWRGITLLENSKRKIDVTIFLFYMIFGWLFWRSEERYPLSNKYLNWKSDQSWGR